MSDQAPVVLRGEGRRPDGTASPVVVTLTADGLTIGTDSAAPVAAAFRDLSSIVVDAGAVRIALGTGPLAERWAFERFGQMTGLLAKSLRDGRLRQRLADGLVEVPASASIDLVEYEAPGASGVAQLLYHDRGVVLAPVDERHAVRRIRRADIGAVALDTSVGGISVTGTGRSLPAAPGGAPSLRLLRMGAISKAHADRWTALRDGAHADAAAITGGFLPDAGFGERRLAASLLLEGHAISPAALGPAWPLLETAVLDTPPFDASYRALRAAAGGENAPRWLATAPERPGATDAARTWFLVGLPGNLVAMELVSEGSHATYLFRVAPRASFSGALLPGSYEAAVAEISEALIDARFLREPMALPTASLAKPEALRYRLALAALPTLAAARARFVARLVHNDQATWERALRDLVAWHGTCRDETAEWPGRAAQERSITEAAAGGDAS